MREVYLIRLSGDVTYRKAGSRFFMENLLVKNIKEALKISGYNATVHHEPARIFVSGIQDPSILKRIFGISSFSRCLEIEFKTLDDLANQIAELYKEKVKGKSFAVKCKRSGIHDFNSMGAAKVIGAKLRPYSSKVDLENPEVTINVEIRDDKAYLYEEKIEGFKGLPIGSGELVLSLFSGGFDSPVASWFVAKRGCKVDFVHFSFAGLSEILPVFSVAQYLYKNWFYGYKPRFIVVRLAGIIREIISKIRGDLRQVALRRAMYLTAEKVANILNHEALITGESIFQATSQTIRNLRIAEKDISLPIIRPLIGFDKEEIINKSKEIGTYDLSLKVEELCSIAMGSLTARANPEIFFEEMKKIDLSVIDKAISGMMELDLREDVESLQKNLKEDEYVIDYAPKDAVLVNLMPEKLRISNAIPINEFNIEKYKDSIIIFICEKGITSKGLAKEYREEGYKAYSLADGFEGYKRLIRSYANSR